MIQYIEGDATEPKNDGRLPVIAHIVNDIGAWGSGFVMALSAKWKSPEGHYRIWATGQGDPSIYPPFTLGHNLVVVASNSPPIYVANMIAQHKVGHSGNGRPPIRYTALAECLDSLRFWATYYKASVHMPKIGSGLAGGDWNVISALIEDALYDIPCWVYEFSEKEI